MFDIEYYQSNCDNGWYSEVECLPIVEGIAHFIKDALEHKEFNFDEFVNDAEEISEIRGLLYEWYDNKPKTKEESNKFHLEFRGVLEEKLQTFSSKYKLSLDID